MQAYQKQFLEFAMKIQVLKFGEFKLKSGRISPYFFNSGLFNTGASLAQLGRYYAEAIIDKGIEFDLLYGPAYKGIPLAAATSVALADHHGKDLPYAFNRKEIKDHGEGGSIVGAPLKDRKILIIDDVISAGTSVRESIDIITEQGGKPAAVIIALDRQELGEGDTTAIQEVTKTYKIEVSSIVTLGNLIGYLEDQPEMSEHLKAINKYRQQYAAH